MKKKNQSKIGAKSKSNGAKTGEKQGSARFRSLCEIGTLLRNQFTAQLPSLRKFSQLRTNFWHTSATSQHRSPHFAAAKRLRNSCEVPKRENSQFRSQSSIPQGISRLRKHFWHTSAISQHSDPHFAAAKWLRNHKA